MNQEALANMVSNQAKKSNVSSKEANKALKMIKSGKMDMGQLAPKITEMLMQGMNGAGSSCGNKREDLRAKLAARRRAAQEGRMSKSCRKKIYDDTKKRMEERKKREEEEGVAKKKREKNQKKKKAQRLKKLEEKLGTISDEFYNMCMKRLQENEFKDQSEKHRCQNIVDIYSKQQAFNTTIKNDEIDELLNEDDLSDISDIEDEETEIEKSVESTEAT